MLVLSRRVGERVVIPDCRLTVTVVSVHGNQVRLGFSAPADVAVLREEVRSPPGPEPAPARESE